MSREISLFNSKKQEKLFLGLTMSGFADHSQLIHEETVFKPRFSGREKVRSRHLDPCPDVILLPQFTVITDHSIQGYKETGEKGNSGFPVQTDPFGKFIPVIPFGHFGKFFGNMYQNLKNFSLVYIIFWICYIGIIFMIKPNEAIFILQS